MLWTLRETTHRMLEARRGNVRARRYREATVRQERHAQALLRIVDLVEDPTSVIGQEEGAEDSKLGLGPGLRPGMARVFYELAEVMRHLDPSEPDPAALASTQSALDGLVDDIRRYRDTGADDGLFVVGNVVTNIRIRPCRQVVDAASRRGRETETRTPIETPNPKSHTPHALSVEFRRTKSRHRPHQATGGVRFGGCRRCSRSLSTLVHRPSRSSPRAARSPSSRSTRRHAAGEARTARTWSSIETSGSM